MESVGKCRPVLSVVVISHNQRYQVARCLDSILSQSIPLDYEIIISDDKSSDGSWHLELEYAKIYPQIHCYQCDSDDCHPIITSERSGYNRSNGFSHSSGRYIVHIDADDWYRPGTNCLTKQIELLEEYPECSMCMQDEWCWEEGSPLESGHTNHPLHRFSTGEILSAESYYQKDVSANNGVMMMRRQNSSDPAVLYGKWYVDTIITDHYLQYGPIVCLDTNDWIYTQSADTITNRQKEYDGMLLWGLDFTVFSAVLIPPMRYFVYTNIFARTMLLDAVRCILMRAPVSESVMRFFAQFEGVFIFRAASGTILSISDKVRLNVIKILLKHCHGMYLDHNSIWIRLIHLLCTR